MAVLDQIYGPNDIKNIKQEDLAELAQEIRDFLIQNISKTGGHLGSNLGAVELTMALHRVFQLPEDKMIWDVGHQSYVHKILTGRKDEFQHLRQFGGLSGFPKRTESPCDCYETGHSSTSISAGLGFAKARDLLHQSHSVISIIGDGAMTGGMAFEAINNASNLHTNYIIVLNDNEMSISENVGGMSRHLTSLRTAVRYQELKTDLKASLKKVPFGNAVVESLHNTKNSIKQLVIPGMIFENMGLTYLGPVDGHDISELERVLQESKKINGVVVVHVLTKKGKGYKPAELHPSSFHGVGPFDVETGNPIKRKTNPDYTNVFSAVICEMAQQDPNIVAITAAMRDGTGLKAFHSKFPERFFDVGIAEGHAVGFAAGLAAAGLKPYFAVYSAFLQRGYDQLIEDVCLQNLPVVFCIDRAGLVGADGDTHQGMFDISYLMNIPNITVMAPKNMWEMADMLRFTATYPYPIAIRYARGEASDCFKLPRRPIVYGKGEVIEQGEEIALVALGTMVETAGKVSELLKEKGFFPTIVNARFAKPMDMELMGKIANSHSLLVTIEESVVMGGFGETLISKLHCEKEEHAQILNIGIRDEFVPHGSVSDLHRQQGLDPESIAEKILAYLGEK